MLSLRTRLAGGVWKRSKSGQEKETFYLGYVQFESLVTPPHGYEIRSVSLQKLVLWVWKSLEFLWHFKPQEQMRSSQSIEVEEKKSKDRALKY